MDKELRESLMEWYLIFGEGEVFRTEGFKPASTLSRAYFSDYVIFTNHNKGGSNFKITPEGIEALKNG